MIHQVPAVFVLLYEMKFPSEDKVPMSALIWLQEWYYRCCDGDWEHQYGVHIGTLDNPGWSVDIDVVGTDLEAKAFQEVRINRSDQDWIVCSVKDGVFKGRGGPRNLEEILNSFCSWVSTR
jgi:hypothetical protein